MLTKKNILFIIFLSLHAIQASEESFDGDETGVNTIHYTRYYRRDVSERKENLAKLCIKAIEECYAREQKKY